MVFDGLNNVKFNAPDDDVVDLVTAVATGGLAYGDVATELGS